MNQDGFERGLMADKSLAASFNSDPFMRHRGDTGVSIQCAFTVADCVGALAVQSSNNNSNWDTVPFKDENGNIQTSLAVTSALNGDSHTFDVETRAAYVRLAFTHTSDGADDTVTAHVVRS
jgi:hypothetical protein